MTRLCRVFDVTRAGYYAWRQRPVSARTRQDRVVLEEMRAIFEGSGGTYGSPRIHRALRARGQRVSRRRTSRLTRAVVDAALRQRRPSTGVIFHSDRGSEFQGQPLRQRLAARGLRQSMTRGGAPDENAHIESFFHSLKAERIHGRVFQTVVELRQHVRQYVRFYNHHRLHSALNYQSPVDYERGAA